MDRPKLADDQAFWVDLTAHGARVFVAEYAGGGAVPDQVLTVSSDAGFSGAERAALAAEGFVAQPDGTFARPGPRFVFGEMRRPFPSASPGAVPKAETRRRMPGRSPFAPAVPEAQAPSPVAPRPLPPRMPPRVPPRPVAPPAEVPAAAGSPDVATVDVPPAVPHVVQAATVVPAPPRPAPPPLRRPPPPRALPLAPAVTAVTAPLPEAALPEAVLPEPVVAEASGPSPEPTPVAPAVAAAPVSRAAAPSSRRADRAAVRAAQAAAQAVLQGPTDEAPRLNRFQNSYRPASRVGSPIAAIPVNLDGATRRALAALEAKHGPIDRYVAKALRWSVERMAEGLSPEQVDAVGLALHAAEEGRDFVLADQTGLGKGRVLAAIARAKVVAGKRVVFITEKENLFSDFFRDIDDIGSLEEFGRPLPVNEGAEISLDTGNGRTVIHPAWRKQELQGFIKSGKAPKGTRLVMASYSQFNRKGSQKTEFLAAMAKGAHVILDESHNAVGDSNTSEAIGSAIEEAASVTNSSATFARSAKNLSAYKRLFPASMRSSDLMDVLASGGQALSEALSTMLAESGSYLRREHDLSSIRIEVVEDVSRTARNRAYADAMSPILGGIAKLARAVNDVVNEKNGPEDENGKRKGKELWTAGNFGSRLAAVMRQFVTCLKVEMCIDASVEALSKGVKPVIVVESTMESLMREMASDDGRPEDADAESGEDAAPAMEELAEGEGATAAEAVPPTFRDALRLFLDRTLVISVRRSFGAEPEKVTLDDKQLVEQAEAIRELIERLPDLTMSPIDEVRTRIEGTGRSLGHIWNADEISARQMRVLDGRYSAMPARDRNALVSGFNAGESDALVITRAASTGLSLHASEKVRDQRQRCMIELQIASNVVERMQFFGRVNRRGQVSTPYFKTLSTGLPLENRLLAMQNRKMADLSANVTGAAANASSMDVPDIIDAVGNRVCRRLLEERPSLAERMHVAMRLPDAEKAEAELYHVNKFLSRLCLLPSSEQETLYEAAIKAYETEVADLLARGASPKGARELEGEWRVVGQETFEPGVRRDGPIFGRPVTVTTLEKTQLLRPVKSEALQEMVREATARLPKSGGEVFGAQAKSIRSQTPQILQRSLAARYVSVRQALGDPRPNAVKDADARLNGLLALIKVARPGSPIQVTGEDGPETGVVVDVRPPPSPEDVAKPSSWSISYLVPGSERPRQISASALATDPGSYVDAFTGAVPPATLQRFDRAPAGETKVRRKVLDGNLVRAVIAARHQGWGSAVTWTDADGVPHRAVLVPKSKQHALATLPGRTLSPEGAMAALEAGGDLWTNRDNPEDGARVSVAGRVVEVSFPAKKSAAKLFEVPGVLAVTGPLKGPQNGRYATLPVAKAPELLRVLVAAGHAFHFDGTHRADVARAAEAAPEGEPEEEPEPAFAP